MRALFMPVSPGVQPRWHMAAPDHVPTLIETPPALTVSSSPGLPRPWFTGSGNSSYPLASHPVGGHFSFCRGVPDVSGPTLGLRPASTVTTHVDGTRVPSGQQFSFYHEGDSLELHFQNNDKGYLLKIDGKYLSFTPQIDAGQTYTRLDFGDVRRRRFDLITYKASFAGIWTGRQDTVYAAPIRGPRVICVGDSFSEASAHGWTNWFAEALGWDDVWTSAVGGTGYTDDGSGITPSWRDRIHDDVVAYAPDLVFFHGGVNDLSESTGVIYDAVRDTVASVRAALPGCIIAGGMNTGSGIESWASSQLDGYDAARNAFVEAGGAWMSPLELPMGFTGPQVGISAQLMDPVAAGRAGNGGTPDSLSGQSGFRVNTSSATPESNLRIGSTVEIGTGATRERVVITTNALSGGRFVFGFDGVFRYAHAAGEPVREVPPCYLTGQGSLLSPTGWGNADRYVGDDGFHPSPEGHIALGLVNARLLRQHLTKLGIA